MPQESSRQGRGADRLEITAAALSELLRSEAPAQLVDVREAWELDICALPQANHISLMEFPARIGELDPEAPVVLICHLGVRSLQAAVWLRQRGFEYAVSLQGGIDAWAGQIDPTLARY